MGWVYGLHALDPVRVKEVSQLDEDALLDHVSAAGITAESLGGDDLADFSANELLLNLASRQVWDLDKSFPELKELCEVVADLAPLNKVFEEASDMKAADLPARFHPEEIGLMGVALPPTLAAAVPAALDYGVPEARARLGATKLGFLKKLTMGSVLTHWNQDDYLWENWQRVVEAVQSVAKKNYWLGLEMG